MQTLFQSTPHARLITIDNLGGGHCGYISFIIGALHLYRNGKAPDFFKRWEELDPHVATLLNQTNGQPLEQLSYNPDLILPLNVSLRKILSQYYLKSLPSENEKRNFKYYSMPEKNMILNEFSHLCKDAIYRRFNRKDDFREFANMAINTLWHFPKMKDIAQKVANLALLQKIDIADEKTLNMFLYAALVYHRDAVQQSYESWSTSCIWMTAKQATELSEIFNIPVVMSTNCHRPASEFIHLQNHRNAHWTVLLYDDKFSYPFKKYTLEKKSRELENAYFNESMREIFRKKENQKSIASRNLLVKTYLQRKNKKFRQLEKSLDTPKKFIYKIENERFFSLFKNCIDALNNDIEFQIESLKLSMYLDEAHTADYQASMAPLLDMRYKMNEDEQLLFNQFFQYFVQHKKQTSVGDNCSSWIGALMIGDPQMSVLRDHFTKRDNPLQINKFSDEDSDCSDTNVLVFGKSAISATEGSLIEDTELVDEFLSNKLEFSNMGIAIGAGLSIISAVAMIASSCQLIIPAIICIVVGTLIGYLLGKFIDYLTTSSQTSDNEESLAIV